MEFYGLDFLLELNKYIPVLDSIQIDCQGLKGWDLIEAIDQVIWAIKFRMKRMGVQTYKMGIITNYPLPGLNEKVVVDSNCPSDTIFVLTKEIDGRPIIKPPHGMTWHEFVLKLQAIKGIMLVEDFPLLVIEAPYLQGRLFNIGEKQWDKIVR